MRLVIAAVISSVLTTLLEGLVGEVYHRYVPMGRVIFVNFSPVPT
jgi:hypothetical protein